MLVVRGRVAVPDNCLRRTNGFSFRLRTQLLLAFFSSFSFSQSSLLLPGSVASLCPLRSCPLNLSSESLLVVPTVIVAASVCRHFQSTVGSSTSPAVERSYDSRSQVSRLSLMKGDLMGLFPVVNAAATAAAAVGAADVASVMAVLA